MEDYNAKGDRPVLPLSALRLLIPPIQLVSAAVWQTIKQRVVADYGIIEEFVTMVTGIVPELLTSHQRAQLILGLRARLILELCRLEGTADLYTIQPHLDRMHVLMGAWVSDARTEAANTDKQPHSNFVDVIRHLLNNPVERERFFQEDFLDEFGTAYDEALQTLMWLFLSRLETFLPLQTFHQVASMFGEVSSVLEDSMESVSQCEELTTLLRYHKDLGTIDHNDGSVDGACILSALKLTDVNRKPQAQCSQKTLSCTSGMEKESSLSPCKSRLSPDSITEHPQIEIRETCCESGTEKPLGEITRRGESAALLQSQVSHASCPLKDCYIQLDRLDLPVSSRFRPVRANRGQRMKMILLEEKRGLFKEDQPLYECDSSNINPSCPPDDEDSSKESSWSYYSDEDSCNKSTISSDSWSHYSSHGSYESPGSTPDNLLSHGSSEDPPLPNPDDDAALSGLSATGTKTNALVSKASSPKVSRKAQCFICNERVEKSLRTHMKTHFPNGDYACPRCDSRFKLLTSLKLHLTRICFEHIQQQAGPDKGQNAYKCGQCSQAFRYKLSLEAHERTHNEFYCSVCRKVLRDATTLARHKASHTPFQCTRCKETFTLFKPLVKHCENLHKISVPFKCNHCPKTFSSLRILISHEWKHSGLLPFQCTECGLRFKNDTDLVVHQRVHTRERPYLCAECGKTFSHNSNLLRHLHFIHSEFRNEKKYFCSECEKSFKEKGALIKHQRDKHYGALFRHPCPYCGKMFSASSIIRHKLIHTGEKPFKCTVPECEKYFRSNCEVKKHVLVHHSTERPHKCDVCGKGFIKKCFLNTHSKIHSGVKPFICHICGKAFPKLYSMKRHKKLVHTFVIN